MGKTYSDAIESETKEPLVINPTSVNNYKDNTTLGKDELEVGNNIILDDGIIETVPGIVKENNDAPGDNPVYALHRSYGKTTEKVCLRLSNGSLKSGPPAFATTVLGGLANKRTPFINLKGKSYGVNETDGLIRYDPKLAQGRLVSIVSPNYRKKIAFFESDETWTGGAADLSANRIEEWSGNASQGLKISCATSAYETSVSGAVTLNLTQFDDTKTSGDDDYIVFWTKHSIRANIDYISVTFFKKVTGPTWYYRCTIYQKDLTEGDYEWTEHRIKKGDFLVTLTPNWNSIIRIDVAVKANANGATTCTFDYMYLAGSPPIVKELQKDIFNCDNNTEETWTGDGTLTNDEAYDGNKSISVVGSGGGSARTISLALTTQLDLSLWTSGEAVLDTDEFVFYIKTNDITALADASCLTLRVGLDAANYYYYTWATKVALGLISNNTWIEVKVKKGDLDALSLGAPNFTNVDYVAFVTSALTGVTKYIYFDHLSLKKANNTLNLATMEAAETWTFSNTASSLVTSGGTAYTIAVNGVTQGLQCMKLYNPSSTAEEVIGTLDWTAGVKDLSLWTGGDASPTSDYITFDISVVNPHHTFEYLEIWFDNNSLASFANAYKYRFKPSDVPGNTNWASVHYLMHIGTLKVAKSQFDQIGTVGGWNTIGAVKFVLKGQTAGPWPFFACIDNLQMKRKPRTSGYYKYKYSYMVGDIYSAPSELSEEFHNIGNDVLLENIKTSQDTRVTARKIFREGGLYPETWMEVKTIEDNVTTTVVDDIDDADLELSMSESVPDGHINIVKGNNLAYEPQSDRLLVWGDPDHKNYVWYSRQGYYLTFDEDSYREFMDEVMFVVPWYSNDLIFYRNRMQKIAGDIESGELNDIPVNVGACSYWAVKPLKNVVPFVSWDNVYIMDGYNVKPIGDQVKGYFKGRETYLSTVNIGTCKDTLYIACKDKTGTPTFNSVVLRYYIPTGSWTVLPSWNVNMWSNWDQMNDLNELYYGNSFTGHIYSINSTTYKFDASGIASLFSTGWIQLPDKEIAIHRILLKAKGTNLSIISFTGYKDLSAVHCASGDITLTTSWLTYVLGPKNIHNLLRGDCIKLEFTHNTELKITEAYFKMKDIVVEYEKLSKRITLNEVTIT